MRSTFSRQTSVILSLVAAALLMAALACDAGTTITNIRVDELPQYVCPSATPIATNTMIATSVMPSADPPQYPFYFEATVSNYEIGVNTPFSTTLYWRGQNAGTIFFEYTGSLQPGVYWPGSNGIGTLGFSGNTAAISGSFTILFPSNLMSATIRVWAANGGGIRTFNIWNIYPGVVNNFYGPPSGSVPPPIYPTARPTFTPYPTYTPYPTPTPYVRYNDYFLGDPIYTAPGGALNVRFRLVEIRAYQRPATATPEFATSTPRPWMTSTPYYVEGLYTYTFQIKNYSNEEYNFFPLIQSFISTVKLADGSEMNGAWGPSEAAALAAGIPMDGYAIQSIRGRQEVTITLAAFAPQGTAWRVSWAMDASTRETGEMQPTSIFPGSNIVSWINDVNTVCAGELQEP